MEKNINELVNEEVELLESAEEIVEVVAKNKGDLLGKVLTSVFIIGGGVCIGGLVKNWGKIQDRRLKKQIAKFEKRGYQVIKPDEVMEDILKGLDDLDEKESEE